MTRSKSDPAAPVPLVTVERLDRGRFSELDNRGEHCIALVVPKAIVGTNPGRKSLAERSDGCRSQIKKPSALSERDTSDWTRDLLDQNHVTGRDGIEWCDTESAEPGL